MWQGEELGFSQVDILFDKLQDPETIANWPLTLNRNGTRTPMPWTKSALNCGFNSAEPWLPLGQDHKDRAVDQQEQDDTSLLALTRHLIAIRNSNTALLNGDLRIIEASGNLLVFERACEEQIILCAFNMGAEPIVWSPAQPSRWQVIETVNNGGLATLLPLPLLLSRALPDRKIKWSVPFTTFASDLFNDRAVAMPTPNEDGIIPHEPTQRQRLLAG